MIGAVMIGAVGSPAQEKDRHVRTERLERIRTIEADHFWFVARRDIVADAVRGIDWTDGAVGRVVDVGCGTGETTTRLFGEHPDRPAITLLEPLAAEPPLVRAALPHLPVRTHTADLCLALDVLEHVPDAAALAEIRRILRPGGHLIATVPAHPWLWSVRDVDAGHLRRYTRRTLAAAVESAGFEIDRLSAFHGALFPAAVVGRMVAPRSRRVRDLEDLPSPRVNRIAGRVAAAETGLARRGVRPPIGSSLIVVATNASAGPT